MLNNVGLNPIERHTLESVRHPGDFSSMLEYAAILGAGHQMKKCTCVQGPCSITKYVFKCWVCTQNMHSAESPEVGCPRRKSRFISFILYALCRK